MGSETTLAVLVAESSQPVVRQLTAPSLAIVDNRPSWDGAIAGRCLFEFLSQGEDGGRMINELHLRGGVELRTANPEPVVRAWRAANRANVERHLNKLREAQRLGIPHFFGSLFLSIVERSGRRLDLGLASVRVVTNAGVAFLVDAFQGATELEVMRYHGLGTASAAEAPTDSALGLELTTQYSTNNTRATGSLAEGPAVNIFRTVATNTFDAPVAITEHGLFSQVTVPGGVLFDRSVFAVVNLAAGDSLETAYELTLNSGG